MTRPTLAAAAACLLLLALPALAAAKPGTSPALVQRSGQFVILHADERDGTSTRQPMLANGLGYTPVRAPDDVWIDPGSRVRLQGTMQNGTLVLGNTLTTVHQLAPSPNAAAGTSAAPSSEDTVVVMFYFSDQTASSVPSVSVATATMNTNTTSLRAYYLEQTYGDVAFQATVLAPVQLSEATPPSSSGGVDNCAFDEWAQEAEVLNSGANPSLASYKHIVYVFPSLPNVCGWSGLAEVGFRHVWINGSFVVGVIAHELGHNLGLWHAGGLSCTSSGSPAPMGDSCSIDRVHYALPQYGDPFDAMGNAPTLRQMSMEHKLALGVLPPTAVQTVTATGQYTLAPMETLSGSVELLRVPKPGGGSYFVEYRRPLGVFDSQSGAITGVLIHTESPDIANLVYDSDTALIDMHPSGTFPSNQWQNAAMGVGEVFNDLVRGITITDVAQDTAGATLQITMPIDTTPPGRPGRLSAVVSGTAVSLQWTAAGDNFGVASYSVARDGTALGSTAATTFNDSGLSPGTTVNYSVTAVDAAGNAGPAATIAVSLPDTLPPTAPTNVIAKLSGDGQVHVTWGAATDNSGVTSYRVLRNGTGIVQANISSYVDKTPAPGSGATVVYTVVAFDLAGNAGPPAAAKPLRAALLRKLGASHLKVTRAKGRGLVRVKGIVSDVQATCRLRLGAGAWHPCKAKTTGAFSVSLRGSAKRVTLSLRDELGRVKRQTLRVP